MSAEEVLNKIGEQADGRETVDNQTMIWWIKKITEAGEFILGLLIVIIIALVPLVVALEIFYINFPIVRGIFNKMVDSESRLSSTFRFVCRDSIKAIENGEIRGCNPNMEYIKIKATSVMFIGFILAIMLQGTSIVVLKTGSLIGNALEKILLMF